MTSRIGLVVSVVAALLLVPACGSDDVNPRSFNAPEGVLFTTPRGQSVEVMNSSADTLALVEWAFSRFDTGRLGEPTVRRIDFRATVPRCDDASGWALAGDGNPEIGICLETHRICQHVNGLVFRLAGKMCILHELSHLWLAQHVTEPTRREFIDHVGAPSWRDPEMPWIDRGVEQAADTIAWGLLGETMEIFGRPLPPCEQLNDGYFILTETAPLSQCTRVTVDAG